MPGQRSDHVPALPGAQADQAYVPGGGTFKLGAQVPLHELPPPGKQGAWVVVVPVPFHPVALRHPTTLQFARRAATRDEFDTRARTPARYRRICK